MANGLLSKVKINDVVYNLKDADSRSKISTLVGEHTVEALGAAAWKAVASQVSEGSVDLPTASAVKAYVDAQVEAIPSFDVVVVTELPEASADTFHKIYLIAQSRTAATNIYDEYITIRSGSKDAYTYSWEKIGSTETDLSGYVKKTQKIATIDLNDDITTEELQTALGLGKMAYADTAKGTVEGQTITGVKATGTPNGTINVTLDQTSTAATLETADYTPSGNVTGTVTANGTVAIAKDSTNGIQISGEVSAPTLDVQLNTGNIQPVTSVGTLPTYTEGSYTAPSVTEDTGAFATAGLVAAIDGTDKEMLVFSAASTSKALTSTGFNAGSYVAPTYTAGTLPVLGTAVSFATTVKSATASAPTFTGDKFAATFTGSSADITASFAGTKVDNALVTAVKYDKASVATKEFTGGSTEFAVGDIAVASKDVTVSPVAKSE
jgi:hypothetical protein